MKAVRIAHIRTIKNIYGQRKTSVRTPCVDIENFLNYKAAPI